LTRRKTRLSKKPQKDSNREEERDLGGGSRGEEQTGTEGSREEDEEDGEDGEDGEDEGEQEGEQEQNFRGEAKFYHGLLVGGAVELASLLTTSPIRAAEIQRHCNVATFDQDLGAIVEKYRPEHYLSRSKKKAGRKRKLSDC
jgi:hypothetical protein